MQTHTSQPSPQNDIHLSVHLPIDPTNPLTWILLLTLLLTMAERTLSATSEVLQSSAALLTLIAKARRSK